MRPEQMLATLGEVYAAQEKLIADLRRENHMLLQRIDEALDDLHTMKRRMEPFMAQHEEEARRWR